MDDVEAAFGIYSDPEVVKGLSMEPLENHEKTREWLARMMDRHINYPEGQGVWAMVLQETNEPIGTLLLKPLPNSERIEIGWHLGKAHWGHGYATEAARWAVARAFDLLKLDNLWAVAFEWNVKSTAIMERLGMTKIGLTSEFYDHELVMYRLTREEYLAQGDR
jgi:RimJ/RimL family protein N-acetyltransferase